MIFLIDDFLSNTFDPERAQKAKNNTIEELSDVVDHRDFIGTYICYNEPLPQPQRRRGAVKIPISEASI